MRLNKQRHRESSKAKLQRIPGLPQFDCPLSDTTLLKMPRRHEPTLVRVRWWGCGAGPTDTFRDGGLPLPPGPRLMTGTASVAELTSDKSLLPTLINLCRTKKHRVINKSKHGILTTADIQFLASAVGLTFHSGSCSLKNLLKLTKVNLIIRSQHRPESPSLQGGLCRPQSK